jgi:hypothetical protein
MIDTARLNRFTHFSVCCSKASVIDMGNKAIQQSIEIIHVRIIDSDGLFSFCTASL